MGGILVLLKFLALLALFKYFSCHEFARIPPSARCATSPRGQNINPPPGFAVLPPRGEFLLSSQNQFSPIGGGDPQGEGGKRPSPIVHNYERTGIPPSARCATSPRGQNTSRFCKRSAAKPSRYPPERSAWRIREYTIRKIIKTEFVNTTMSLCSQIKCSEHITNAPQALAEGVFIDFYCCVSRQIPPPSAAPHSPMLGENLARWAGIIICPNKVFEMSYRRFRSLLLRQEFSQLHRLRDGHVLRIYRNCRHIYLVRFEVR